MPQMEHMKRKSRGGHSYYDDLRKKRPSGFTPIFTDENRVGRNLHRYTPPAEENEEDVIFCHTPVFIRYTTKGNDDYSDAGYGGAAGAMLAIHHWNNGNGVVVKSIENINETCPIRFTTEIFDTRSNAVPAVRGLTDMMIRKPTSIEKPQPCAIVGTLYSSVSTKFAITTGVFDLLQVSPGASSDALDDKTQFPLFSRTHPADGGAALLLPKYLKEELGVTNFAMVFVHTDGGFGTAYQKVVLKYAEDHGMNVKSIPITYLSDPQRKPSKEQIKKELSPLLDSKLNYILGVFFFSNFEPIMEAAVDLGLAGPDRFWFFAGSLSDRIYEKSITYEKGSTMAKAMYGNAIITDGGAAPGTDQYKSFLGEWNKLGNDEEFLNYINSKQPHPMPITTEANNDNLHNFNRTRDYFYREPIAHIAIYSYEAIIGIGLAACEAALMTNSSYANNDVFSGSEHHKCFVNTNFLSASGNVTFGPSTNSRNETSTYFVVANILETEESERNTTGNQITLQGRNHKYFDALSGDWKTFETTLPFIYSDRTINAPPEIYEAIENENLISNNVRAYCLVESVLAMAASIAFLLYTVKTMKKRGGEIARSQPPFLIMICVGTFLMATSLIPFSVDEAVTRNKMALDFSCSMFFWFFSLGLTITFAALFSKLRRATKMSEAGLRLRRINIRIKDVLKPFLALFFSNAIILLIWQTIGNLRWERRVLELNEFDQVVSSEGSCDSDDYIWYLSSLMIVNGIALLQACYEAYRGRNTASEINESKYVGMAMICIFQSCFFGVPLIIISSSNKSAYLFVAASICFVICIATLLFIFLPKILRQRRRDSVGGVNSRVTGISEEAQRLRQTMRLTGTSLISQNSLSQLRSSTASSKRSSRGDAFPLRETVIEQINQNRSSHSGEPHSSLFRSTNITRSVGSYAGSVNSLAVLSDNDDDERQTRSGREDCPILFHKMKRGSLSRSQSARPILTSITSVNESISEVEASSSDQTPEKRSSISFHVDMKECSFTGDEESEPFLPTHKVEDNVLESCAKLEASDSFKNYLKKVENLNEQTGACSDVMSDSTISSTGMEREKDDILNNNERRSRRGC